MRQTIRIENPLSALTNQHQPPTEVTVEFPLFRKDVKSDNWRKDVRRSSSLPSPGVLAICSSVYPRLLRTEEDSGSDPKAALRLPTICPPISEAMVREHGALSEVHALTQGSILSLLMDGIGLSLMLLNERFPSAVWPL